MVIDGGNFGVFTNNNGPADNEDRDAEINLECCVIQNQTGKGLYAADAKKLNINYCIFENNATGEDTGTKGDYCVDVNLIGVQDAVITIQNTEFIGYNGAKAVVKVTQRGGPSDKGAGDIPMDKEPATIKGLIIKNCSFDQESTTPVDVRIGTDHKTPDEPELENTTANFPVTITGNETPTRVEIAPTGKTYLVPINGTGQKGKTGEFVVTGGETPDPDPEKGPVTINDEESFDTLEEAVESAITGDIISLNEDITVEDMGEDSLVAVVIPEGVTIEGNNHSISAGNFSNKHIIGVTDANVTIKDVVIEGKSGIKSGIVVSGPSASLNGTNITVKDCPNCGIQITNGATVTLDNYQSSGNAWGSINVDKGTGGNVPHLTFNSGTMAEDVEIYTEILDEDCITALSLTEIIGVGDTLKGFKYFTSNISKLGVVTVNDTVYEKMTDAIAALEDGDLITLYADYDQPLHIIGVEVTIDMNGHKIENTTPVYDVEGGTISLLAAEDGANITITGNGTIKSLADDAYAIDVQGGSTVTINNGTYVGNITAVYVQNGHLYVKGGDFSIQQLEPTHQDERFTLNCLDSSYKDGSATIEVTGGTFNKFDPANNLAEGEGTNFCAEGYISQQNGDKYTVIKA